MSDALKVITVAIERSPWLPPRQIAEVVENDLVNARLLPDTDGGDPADEMRIREMSVKDGVANLTMTSGGPESEAVLLAMADAMGSMLDEHDATNYVEFDLRKRGMPAYSVCVRRYNRPTPHQLRKEADARAEAAEGTLAELMGDLSKTIDTLREHADSIGTGDDGHEWLCYAEKLVQQAYAKAVQP